MTIERIAITSREQWLELRKHDCTASDIAAICGEGMYGSAAKVWAEKRGLIPPAELNEAMKRGHYGEAAVFEALLWERPDWELRRAKVYFRDTEARLGATPDGAAVIPGRGLVVVQAKVIAAPVFKRDWLVDQGDDIATGEANVPMGYQLQTLTEAMLAETTGGVLAVLVVDTFKWTLRTFDVDRHAGAEKMIRDKVAAFRRDYLETGDQPPLEIEKDADLVRRLYPKDDGTTIDLTSNNQLPELLDTREGLKLTIGSAKDELEKIETQIKAMLGEHTFAKVAGGLTVSWKLQHRKAYEVKAAEFRALKVLPAKTEKANAA